MKKIYFLLSGISFFISLSAVSTESLQSLAAVALATKTDFIERFIQGREKETHLIEVLKLNDTNSEVFEPIRKEILKRIQSSIQKISIKIPGDGDWIDSVDFDQDETKLLYSRKSRNGLSSYIEQCSLEFPANRQKLIDLEKPDVLIFNQSKSYASVAPYHARSLKIYDLNTKSCIGEFSNECEPLNFSTEFNADGSQIITTNGKILSVSDISSGRKLKTFAANSPIDAVAIFPDDKRYLIGTREGLSKIDLDSNISTLLSDSIPMNGKRHRLRFISMNDKGSIAATTAINSESYHNKKVGQIATIWDVDSEISLYSLPNNHRTHLFLQSAVNSLSKDGFRLLNFVDGETIKIWDLQSKRYICSLPHDWALTGAKFNKDGSKILTWRVLQMPGNVEVTIWYLPKLLLEKYDSLSSDSVFQKVNSCADSNNNNE